MSDQTTQRIKALALQDLTYQEMCRILNREGHRTAEGHEWSRIDLLVKVHQLRHELTTQPASVQLTRKVAV